VNFAGLAQSAGYRSCHVFDDLAAFTARIGSILQEPGPTFVTMKVEPGPPPKLDYPYMHGARVREEFKAALNGAH
jgi:hypothetical protein